MVEGQRGGTAFMRGLGMLASVQGSSLVAEMTWCF